VNWVPKTLEQINQMIGLMGESLNVEPLPVVFFISLAAFLIYIVKSIRVIEKKNTEIAVSEVHIKACEDKYQFLLKRFDELEKQFFAQEAMIKVLLSK
jgi:hypothetical protein